MDKPTIKAPGLKLRPRANRWAAYWVPAADAVKLGFPKNIVPLSHLIETPELLIDRCQRQQEEMLGWLDGHRKNRLNYDRTIGSVLRIYQTHKESPFHTLAPGSRHPYTVYLGRLEREISEERVDHVTALDIKLWHRGWSAEGAKPAAGNTCLAVLKAALTFAIVLGHRECRPLRDDIRELRLPGPKSRTQAATAAEVTKAIAAAHALGRPSAALCYALQFETALRQWDAAGQWYPLEAPIISDVIAGRLKWAGLEWRHIGEDMILRYTPTKTAHTSAAEVTIDLRMCPMALEEIARVPPEKRVGPVVVSEATGQPYTQPQAERVWKAVKRAAGLPDTLWSRDLRASAITEARSGGATNDDGAKVAGHSKKSTTAEVYDRERLEAHRRFAAARQIRRGGEGAA